MWDVHGLRLETGRDFALVRLKELRGVRFAAGGPEGRARLVVADSIVGELGGLRACEGQDGRESGWDKMGPDFEMGDVQPRAGSFLPLRRALALGWLNVG